MSWFGCLLSLLVFLQDLLIFSALTSVTSHSKFILIVDTVNGTVRRFCLKGMDENDNAGVRRKSTSREAKKTSVYRMCKKFSSNFNLILFYQEQR